MKLSILIPCFNEERTIKVLLEKVIENLNQKIYTTGESCMVQLEYGTNQNIGLTTDLLFNAYSLNENSD